MNIQDFIVIDLDTFCELINYDLEEHQSCLEALGKASGKRLEIGELGNMKQKIKINTKLFFKEIGKFYNYNDRKQILEDLIKSKVM